MRILKKVFEFILSRTFLAALLCIVQVGLFVFLTYWFASAGAIAYALLTIISVLVLLAVFEKDDLNPSYKLMWILIITLLPLSGALFYLLWGHRNVPRRSRKRMDAIEARFKQSMRQDPDVMQALADTGNSAYYCAQYLYRYGNAALYVGNNVEYYAFGEDFFEPYLAALRSAKKFIFLEFFIYQPGHMLDTITDILRQKVSEGVDVRMLYDGFGSLFTLPKAYIKMLHQYGIQCKAFSPLDFTIHLSDYAMMNHRNHRKVTVIDGVVGFSGGLNLADEYINKVERFGRWKDTSFKLCGDAVFSLTTTFLETWDYVSNSLTDYEEYRPAPQPKVEDMVATGFVQPYSDSPLDSENVSENAYLRVIQSARQYVYMATPYLILDNEMISTLTLAAKSGIDIRIITPAIPDKPTVFLVTRSYYRVLLEAGVRIFEFTPGFIHAKMYVCDDELAIVGSANMDYRSLYLHFENSVLFCGGEIVQSAKQDMLQTLAVSKEMTLDDLKQIPIHKRFVQRIARFFAPML